MLMGTCRENLPYKPVTRISELWKFAFKQRFVLRVCPSVSYDDTDVDAIFSETKKRDAMWTYHAPGSIDCTASMSSQVRVT